MQSMPSAMNSLFIDTIFEQYRQLGHRQYGEEVTELEHALQAALLAQQHNESPSLIAAALLHDCGHLLHGLDEGIASDGINAAHEIVGADVLAIHFPPEVSEPVRLHVAAKRYLCRVNPSYLARLSSASQLSLELQGGPMTAEEANHFEKDPFFDPALRLRGYDDAAKMVGVTTPKMESFRSLLTPLLESRSTLRRGVSEWEVER